MSSIVDAIVSNITAATLPILVTLAFIAFASLAKISIRKYILVEDIKYDGKPSLSDNIMLLVGREDVTLRVIEEVHQSFMGAFENLSWNSDSGRISSLRRIQHILRNGMRESVKSEDFSTIRDRAIRLIDEAQEKIDLLQQQKPLDGLQEPEKSLLIDMLADIPNEKQITRQKALQLADIIKFKHQDMLQLQQENTKAAAWTRWGTYGTVFFGVLSILLSIYTTIK